MVIWTVASIEEDDQKRTRSLFHALGRNAQKCTNVSNMLAQEALREMMEMCTMHMSIIEQEIEKFNEVAIDIAFALVSQLEDYERERESLENAIIEYVSQLINDSLDRSHKKWTRMEIRHKNPIDVLGKYKRRDDRNLPILANKSTQNLLEDSSSGEVSHHIDCSIHATFLKEHFPSMNVEKRIRKVIKKNIKKEKKTSLESEINQNTGLEDDEQSNLTKSRLLPMIALKHRDSYDEPNWFGLLEEYAVIGIATWIDVLLLAAGLAH